ncbi:MAG: hypothetical protein SH817_08895 [Leptospira sp.]|nr:hypothetical protein [Leptospira sp.]
MKKINNGLESFFRFLNARPILLFSAYFLLIIFVSLGYWRKYEWSPSSMVNFGRQFALQNVDETPKGAIIFLGEEADLGAGYDGQIFYYFSRSLTNFSFDWPKGFDESYRAPRIGYPFLISLFGIFGKWGSIFGMYFWNITLWVLSFFALRSLLDDKNKHLSVLYLFSPFALGSYYVLVSDSVMVSLVIIAYYLFRNGKYIPFVLLSSLAILTKEPALFFLFPLGLFALYEKDFKKIAVITATLIIPITWHLYLSYRFPNWRASRLTDFILPFEGMISYAESIFFTLNNQFDIKALARLFSRLPLVFLFFMGTFLCFTGNLKRGWHFRIALLFIMFMIGTAGFYHFWSVYENVSRMFTLSIPMLILLANEDERIAKFEYIFLTILILFLFLVKVLFISKTLHFQIGL